MIFDDGDGGGDGDDGGSFFYHYCCCYCYCLLTFVINIGICRFRSMWERYCRGVNAIVYMVDAADQDKIEVPVSPTP